MHKVELKARQVGPMGIAVGCSISGMSPVCPSVVPGAPIQSGDWDSTLVEEGSALEKGSLLGQTFRTALFVYESAYFA